MAGKSAVMAHFEKITDATPAPSMTAKEMRNALINLHYENDELRQLANGAGIRKSIRNRSCLREALLDHFAALL